MAATPWKGEEAPGRKNHSLPAQLPPVRLESHLLGTLQAKACQLGGFLFWVKFYVVWVLSTSMNLSATPLLLL